MIIKVNDSFLDFDDVIDIERQAKLFEDITTNAGDYSYTFPVPNTSHNRDTLGLLSVLDRVNKVRPCQILNDSGVAIYYGNIYIDRVNDTEIECTFYSGNSDWIQLIADKKLTELLTIEKTVDPETEGNLILPFVDTGLLGPKGSKVVHQEDLLTGMMVKDVVRSIFSQSGLKVTGDIFDDPVFSSLCYSYGGINQDLTPTTLAFPTYSHTGSGSETIPFGTYTADRNMTLDIHLFFKTSAGVAGLPAREFLLIDGTTKLRANGEVKIIAVTGGFSFSEAWTTVNLAAGDSFVVQIQAGTSQTITEAVLTITQTNLFQVRNTFPDELQTKFLSDVLTPFNVVIDYDSNRGEVEINLFKNVAKRAEVDLSDTLESFEIDYSDFISNYSKRNIFQWAGDLQEISDYNDVNELEYGSGIIEGENVNLSDSDTTVFESDIEIPFQYNNTIFEGQLAKMDLKTPLENQQKTATFSSVSNASGKARFVLNSVYKLKVGDQVLITDSERYAGLHVVDSVPVSTDSDHRVEFRNLNYIGTDSGTMDRVKYQYSGKAYLFLVLPVPVTEFLEENVDYYSLNSGFSTLSNVNFGFAVLIEEVGSIKNSLSFGDIEGAIPMRNMLQNYWPDFSNVISNGIGIRSVNYVKEQVFTNLKFKNPIRLTTDKFNSIFYLNRITGYKGSALPSEFEFIKIR